MYDNFIHRPKKTYQEQNTVILLAANKLKTKHQTPGIPILKISNSERVIDKQIDTILNYNNQSDIIFVIGHDAENIINYLLKQKYNNVRVIVNDNYKDSTSLYSLKLAINASIKSNVYIIHADRLFNDKTFDIKNNKTYLYSNMYMHNNYNIGISYHKNKKLLNISYGLPNIWSEIIYLHHSDYEIFKYYINNLNNTETYTIPDLISLLSTKIKFYIHDDKDVEIINLKDVYYENYYLQQF